MTLLFDDTKRLEKALGEEAAASVIEVFNNVDARILAELRTEVATKADFFELKTEFAKLEGALRTDMAKMEGRIDARLARLENMVKVLIGLAALAVTFFSPVAEKLIGIAK